MRSWDEKQPFTDDFQNRCSRGSHRRYSVKKGVFINFAKFTGKHRCQSLFLNKVAGLRPQACNFIKKETLAQLFSYEFCEIYKNTFYYRTPLVVASGVLINFAILEPFSNKVAGLFLTDYLWRLLLTFRCSKYFWQSYQFSKTSVKPEK